MHTSRFRAALGGLAFAAPVWVMASGQVTGVKVTRLSSGVEVVVTGDHLPKPSAKLSTNGKAYTLDFDAPLKGKPMEAKTGFASIPKVSVSSVGHPAKARVSLAVGAGSPKLSPDGKGGWKVTLAPKTEGEDELRIGPPVPVAKKPISKDLVATASAKPSVAKPARPFAATKPKIAEETDSMPRPPKAAPKAAPKVFAAKPVFSTLPPAKPSYAPPKKAEPAKVAVTAKAKRMVSLDFVDTDVDQVFRALAMQTGANILTSGDVKKADKSVTISLHDVDVDQAVNLLCTISGLRWAKTDGTYVVTTKEQFQETTRMAAGQANTTMETRVVPLFSGEGSQVKTAVLKAIGGDTTTGRFEIFLPSEKLSYDQKQEVTPEGRMGKDADSAKLTVTSSEKGNAKDGYLVIVGSPSRLDEVQNLASHIDGQICTAMGKERPSSAARFTRIYDVHGGRAADLVAAIGGPNATKVGNVELLATPANSIARQTIVLNGREDEVNSVWVSLQQLDSNDTSAPIFKAVDLSYTDPRSMREMLVANVPGLAVTIPPASVGNPRLYHPNDLRGQAEERGTELPAPQGGGTPTASGMNNSGSGTTQKKDTQVTVGSDDAALNGLTQPFQSYEDVAMPMRLVLRGTEEQVLRGQEFIRALDVAPKHVAIELRVMELNRDDILRAGLDINLKNGGSVSFVNLRNAHTDAQDTENTIKFGLGSKSTPLDVTATLDKIANKNNLISRPNTIALDGRETELFVGDVIRYIKSIISSQNGVSVETDSVRVGVRMAILPRIGGDGSITMDLRPAVSFLRGFDTITQVGGKLPQTSERVAQASFNMKSGETIAIAGLITDQDRRTVQGLPFLMDLPLVGQLFRKTTNERVRSELVLFVTARTIDGPLGSNQQTLPGQTEMPAHGGFPGKEAGDMRSRTKAGAKESKDSGPGKPVAPFSPPAPKPKNG